MAWDTESLKNSTQQVELFVNLNKDEEEVMGILSAKEKVALDLIAIQVKLSIPKLIQVLMQLELKGLVRALPGNQYAKS
jgi:DNA processing protein